LRGAAFFGSDAVAAAPKNHKVIFENDRLRVLEVTLEPEEEEPTHHHRWPSVFVLDQVQGPIYDMTPDGTPLPPNRDVMRAFEAWDGQGCLVANMAPQPVGGYSMPPVRPSMAFAWR